jgi:hypothetical protein
LPGIWVGRFPFTNSVGTGGYRELPETRRAMAAFGRRHVRIPSGELSSVDRQSVPGEERVISYCVACFRPRYRNDRKVRPPYARNGIRRHRLSRPVPFRMADSFRRDAGIGGRHCSMPAGRNWQYPLLRGPGDRRTTSNQALRLIRPFHVRSPSYRRSRCSRRC